MIVCGKKFPPHVIFIYNVMNKIAVSSFSTVCSPL